MEEACEACKSKGEILIGCAECRGKGFREFLNPRRKETCIKCDGTGKETKICERCNGKGNISLNDIARLMARMTRTCG